MPLWPFLPNSGPHPLITKECVVCGSTPLVNSHLLPKAFGLDVKGDGKYFWIGTARKPGKNLSQAGVFDRFLCRTHEEAMHDYEDYAIGFARGFEVTDAEVRARTFRRDNTDNEALIRFVCSVLWRFHHSDREEAADVDLGEWEPNMRDLNFGGSVYQAPDVYLSAIYHPLMPKDAWMALPVHGTHWSRRAIQFSVHGLVFTTKLDHEEWPAIIQRAVLNQTPNWISSTVCPVGDREWRDIRVVAQQIMSRREKP